uniref:Uncharacterized protein n=1 Tax=Branchiostoma floridae TaxID=7739 RepID=C3ZVR2_BRAFL|eukprot:XP_002587393.1 hypothetical protein BRAFLDRAFT_96280 [Branchiostoma floridae]
MPRSGWSFRTRSGKFDASKCYLWYLGNLMPNRGLLTVAMTIMVIDTVLCAGCRDEGNEQKGGEIIVDEEGFEFLKPFLTLKAEQLSDLYLKIHERAIPAWTYPTPPPYDGLETPSGIAVPDCSTSTCEDGTTAHPLYAPRLVACAFTDENGVRKYSVQKKQFAVACTCVHDKVSDAPRKHGKKYRGRRRRKNREGQRRSRKRQGKKRHGSIQE